MSADKGEEVEVLYDYEYSDEHGLIEIHEGDIYRLLERTNSEWWHVCAQDKTPDDGFYVPAQYVRVLEKKALADQEVDSAISSLDDVLGDEEEVEQTNCLPPSAGQTVSHSRDHPLIPGNQSATQGPPVINGMGKPMIDTERGDYVNLDEFRVAAKIPALLVPSSSKPFETARESDYANLPFQLQHQKPQQLPFISHDQNPRLQDGKFKRVLVEGLPWDVYEEEHSKRKFFHNRETGELTWKPPRKDKPASPVSAGPFSTTTQLPLPSFPDQIPSLSIGSLDGDSQEEYSKTEEEGNVFFVNNFTSEKWQQLADETGWQYYHRCGSNDTEWDLPTTPRSKLEGRDASPRNGEATREGITVNTNTINRGSKSKSMYGKIEQTSQSTIDPKSCTLPHNFAPGSQIEKSPSLPSFQLQPPGLHRFEDPYSSYLNKTKIAEMGKKKIKKNWAQTYVVLQASNLVFYKDQKAAAQKPGSPHGKPDGVISLQGAKVDFNLSKDITSRRNTIMLSVNSGSQFLLYSDDEKIIHEWLVRLKVVANDIKEEPSPREHDGSVGRSMGRSMSESSGQSGDERRNMFGIKAKLLNFLIRRPTQEDLIKQGIIKDAVFGSQLQDLCDRDKSVVPNFVLECISAVESKGLEHDGLYRVSGNLAEIQRLRYVIDKDEDHDLLAEQWDVHTPTGALKLFFRELKEPLFPFKNKCVNKFVDASKKESRKEKLKAFKDALSSLLKCNHETVRVLFQHLKNVVQFSAENRMQSHNLAIVFGPTLMWAAEGENFSDMAIHTLYHSKIVEFLLLEYENLFR